MLYTDKRMICGDCMSAFVFTVDEQQANAFSGLVVIPTRCPECRSSRAAVRASRDVRPMEVPRGRRTVDVRAVPVATIQNEGAESSTK